MGEVYLVVGDNKLKGRFMYFADSLLVLLESDNPGPSCALLSEVHEI